MSKYILDIEATFHLEEMKIKYWFDYISDDKDSFLYSCNSTIYVNLATILNL